MNIAAAKHSMIRKMGHITAVLLAASVLQIRGQSSNVETMPPELPLPPEYKLAEAAAANIEASKALPPEAKNLVQNQFHTIKLEFTQLWTPIQDAYTQYLKNLHAVAFELENFKAAKAVHDSKKSQFNLPEEAAELDAYNKEAADGNTWLANIKQKGEQADTDYRQSRDDNAKPFEEWRNRSLRQFNKTAQDLLSGKLQFRKGLAWDQLVEAAKNAEAANLIFDGGKNSDPNVVDATGVVPLTTEERKRLQNQPSVQKPRGFRVAPNKEPPPPGQ